ncbi:MAG: hypothetical protein AB7D07_11855 [Desulfovibrionaceae bacterium]
MAFYLTTGCGLGLDSAALLAMAAVAGGFQDRDAAGAAGIAEEESVFQAIENRLEAGRRKKASRCAMSEQPSKTGVGS